MNNTKDESKEEIKAKSVKYLAITLIFIMLPYIVKFIAFVFTDLPIDMIEDFTNGAFIMYAISLLAPIWYTVETVFDIGIKKGNNVPVAETIITIVVSMAAYVIFFICKCVDIVIFTIPSIVFSIVLMGWSVYLAYKIHKDEISVIPPDFNRRKDENELKICIEKAENGENIETTRKGIEGELVLSDFEEDDE